MDGWSKLEWREVMRFEPSDTPLWSACPLKDVGEDDLRVTIEQADENLTLVRVEGPRDCYARASIVGKFDLEAAQERARWLLIDWLEAAFRWYGGEHFRANKDGMYPPSTRVYSGQDMVGDQESECTCGDALRAVNAHRQGCPEA